MGSEVTWSEVKWSEVKWRDVMIFSEMGLLSLIYSYVAVCRFCAVRCVIIICFYLLFSNHMTYVFSILFMDFLFCIFVFYFVYSVFLYFLCTVSHFLYSCLFPIFVQGYWPLPPGGNPIAVNKYHTGHHNTMSHTEIWEPSNYDNLTHRTDASSLCFRKHFTF